MELFKIRLMTKNSFKNSFYLYLPVVRIDNKYYFCESIKSKIKIDKKKIDINSLVIKREIPKEYYAANGIKQ